MLKITPRFVIILMTLIFLGTFAAQKAAALSGRSGAANSSVSDGSSTQSMTLAFTDNYSGEYYFPGKWKYGGESTVGRGYNGQDHYSHSRAVFGFERMLYSGLDPIKIEANAGAHQLENLSTKVAQTIPVGNFKTSYNPKDWELSLDLSHDYSHLDGAHPGGVSRYLRRTKVNPWGRHWWSPRNRTQFSGTYLFINDGNIKADSEVVSAYSVISGKHSVWLGMGAQQITFEDQTWMYWSPTRNIGIGPRLEADFNFHQKLRGTLRASVNRAYEKDNKAWGHGYYAYAKLEYGKQDDWKFALVYERIESQVNHYLWFMNQFNLTAEALF